MEGSRYELKVERIVIMTSTSESDMHHRKCIAL